MSEQVRLLARVSPVIIWVAVAPFVLWTLGRVIGLDTTTPLAQLMAFTPYVAVAAVIPLVLALVARQRWVVGVSAVVVVTLAVCVLPRAFGSPSTMDGVPVTVMSMNMFEGGANADAIVKVVREQKVDVLTLQEFTPTAQRRLAEAGLDEILPYHETRPMRPTQGSGLYSRFPLADPGFIRNTGSFYQVHGVVQVPGAQPVAVESVHPVAPAEPSSVPLWKQDLQDQKPAPSTGQLQILAGDFNSTLDHSELRRLIGTGYHDAADTVGKGLTPTWPYDGPRAAVTPKVTIDHVLVDSRIGVTDFHAYTIPDTDHRTIVSRLVLPRL